MRKKNSTESSSNNGSTTGAPEDAEPVEMETGLRAKCKEIVDVLSRTTSGDALGRYKIGLIVADIKKSEAKYGKSAVAKAAKAVSLSLASLYSYAEVADAWANDQFGELVKRRNTNGVPLTFAHFIAIAKVSEAVLRDYFVERALTEAFSVNELRLEIRGGGNSDALADIATSIDAFAKRMAKWSMGIAGLENSDDPGELAKHLASGAAKLRALQQRCDEVARAIEQKKQQLGRPVADGNQATASSDAFAESQAA